MSDREMTKIDLIKHIGLTIAALVLIILFIFNIYLPVTTNHGDSLTVPNLEGIPLDELNEFLEERHLRYEVEPDSGYSAKYPALSVLKQYPLPNAKVKQGRKIYVTLNSTTPPVVSMPKLIQKSLKNARLELRSLGLSLGEIRYKPDFALNTILEQQLNGKDLAEGDLVPKDSRIDFVVGDGLGSQTIQMVDFTSFDLEEAIFVMRGNGLKLGNVVYAREGSAPRESKNSNGETVYETVAVEPGKIFKQSPDANEKTRIGMEVDLWIVEVDSAALLTTPTLDIGGG